MNRKHDEPFLPISETETKLLELLVTGASSKSIAEQMGLKDGTTRVYLHSLYKRIGVNNKTSAVTWYLANQRQSIVVESRQVATGIETFGDRALDQGLLAALGMMEVFLGPYGRMWDTLLQIGAETPQSLDATLVRSRGRRHWNAMVQGDFSQAAAYFDREGVARLFIESPSDAVVLAASLLLGGFTNRATKAMGSLKLKRGGSIGITLDEKVALTAIGDVVNDSRREDGLAALYKVVDKNSLRPVFRHLLIVALFHLYKMLGQAERARDVGNTIWLEAERARNHLQEMGDATFPANARLPMPPKLPKADLSRYMAHASA